MVLDETNFPEFRKAYNSAVKEKRKVFHFQTQPIDMGYAKHLINYMASLKKRINES